MEVTTLPSVAPAGALEGAVPLEAKPRKHGKKYYGKTAKVGAVWSMLRQGGNELFGIPMSMIMARLLTPRDFGISAASSFFILLAARLTQFGFGTALVRHKNLRPEHATSVYVVNQVMGIVTFAILYFASPLVGSYFRSPEAGQLLSLAAVTFVLNPLGTVPAALLQRRMQFSYTVTADWTDTIVGALVTVGFALNGHGYWSFVYGHLTGLVVRVILQMYLAAWTPKFTVSRAALKELLSFGFGIQAKRLLDYASSNLDNLVVGRVLGMSALGIYDKAFTTMNKMVVRLTLGHAPFRIFSIIHEDAERFRRAYARLILSITLLGYPLMAGCIVMAQPLFALLYGQRWSAAVFPFQLLCAGGMLKLLNAYASQANEAAGNIWRQTRRQAYGTVLVVVGAAVGSRWGLPGAAVGVLVAIAALTIAMQDLVREATGLTWRGLLTPQIPALTCAALLVGVLLATGVLLRIVAPSPAPWQQVLVQGTAGALFYAAFMLASPFAAVHDVVSETLNDLLPAGAARFLNRFRRPITGQHA